MMAAMALVFFAAFSLNLLLNFALGVRELILRERTPPMQFYYPWLILFVSTFLLWVFFARLLFFTGGALDFILIFPFSVLGGMGLETLFFRFFGRYIGLKENPQIFSAGSPYNGLCVSALFLTLRLALSPGEGLILSFVFSSGALLSFLIIKEIQKRSFLEAIPRGLRGTPILLISMGFLSLVFSAASVLFLKIFL